MEPIPNMEPRSLHELFEKRFHHVETEWPNHPFFRVLVTEASIYCYDHVESLMNLDEINSVKNRRKKSSKAENNNTINHYWMLHGLSYVDEMLTKRGILRHGLVTIRSAAYDFYNHRNFQAITSMEQAFKRAWGASSMAKAFLARAIMQGATRTNSDRVWINQQKNKSENALYGTGAQDNLSERDRDEAQSCIGLYFGIGETNGTYHYQRRRSQRSQDTFNHDHPSSIIARAPVTSSTNITGSGISSSDFGENHSWQMLAQQLGFHNQLIAVWGDFLPSTLQLLTIAFRLGKDGKPNIFLRDLSNLCYLGSVGIPTRDIIRVCNNQIISWFASCDGPSNMLSWIASSGRETLAGKVTTKEEIWGEMFAVSGEATGDDVTSNEHSLGEGITANEANGTKWVSLITEADEVRRRFECMQEGRQLDEVSQELSPAKHKSVPYNITFAGSSILNEWQELYLIGDQSAYDANIHESYLTVGDSGKTYGEDDLFGEVANATDATCYWISVTDVWDDKLGRERYGENNCEDKLSGQTMGRIRRVTELSNRRGVTQDAIFRLCTDSVQLCYGRVSTVHCM